MFRICAVYEQPQKNDTRCVAWSSAALASTLSSPSDLGSFRAGGVTTCGAATISGLAAFAAAGALTAGAFSSGVAGVGPHAPIASTKTATTLASNIPVTWPKPTRIGPRGAKTVRGCPPNAPMAQQRSLVWLRSGGDPGAMHRTTLVLRGSVGIFLPALIVTGCPSDPTASTGETTAGSTSTDAATSDTATTTLDPDSSTSVDPDSSTSTDPGTSTTGDPDSSGSTEPTTSGGPGCGNEAIEGDEVCDGNNLDGRDCMSEDFLGGALACTPECTLDTSNCTSECGDANVQGNEQCEGNDFDGEDCVSQGFDDGELACNADCSLDVSGCVTFGCGSGGQKGEEVCDGDDLVGEDCVSLGFAGGTLACADDCGSFDVSGCLDNLCGNDIQEDPEVCDGDDLAQQTCVALGHDGGTLACGDACDAFDVSGCSDCGDAIISGDEDCDGGVGMATCATLGFAQGQLACAADCLFDVSDCSGGCNFGAAEIEFQSDGDFVNQGDAWQSFTADSTGQIVQIDLYWNVGGVNDSFTMNLYEGEGTGGALLHSELFPGQGMGVWVGFDVNVLSTPVPLVAGTVYTVQGVDTFGWQTASGAIVGANSSLAGQHKNIRVTIEPCQ